MRQPQAEKALMMQAFPFLQQQPGGMHEGDVHEFMDKMGFRSFHKREHDQHHGAKRMIARVRSGQMENIAALSSLVDGGLQDAAIYAFEFHHAINSPNFEDLEQEQGEQLMDLHEMYSAAATQQRAAQQEEQLLMIWRTARAEAGDDFSSDARDASGSGTEKPPRAVEAA